MPLSVEIKINGRNLETIWIARMERLRGEDDNHQYIVGVGTRSTPPWASVVGDPLPKFAQFHHRYGDGARTCVIKALAALTAFEQDEVGRMK